MQEDQIRRNIYSAYKTMNAAKRALYDHNVTGEIINSDQPLIERKLVEGHMRFCITLPIRPQDRRGFRKQRR
jgi:hypothetical protein